MNPTYNQLGLSSQQNAWQQPGLSGVAYDPNAQQVSNTVANGLNAASQPTPQVQQQTAPASNPYASNYGGSSSGAPSAMVDAINNSYDTQIGNTNNQIGLLGQINASNQAGINSSYNAQMGTPNLQYQEGQSNLDQAQVGLDQSRTRSLRDLTHQMQGMVQGYGNQLGVAGAGDSSAADYISKLLTNQGNRGINDLNQQADLQQSGIAQQHKNLDLDFANNKALLDDWKNTQMRQLANDYQQTLGQLNSYVQTLGGNKAQTLAYYNAAAAKQAMDGLTAINDSHSTAINDLASKYSQLNPAAVKDMSPYSQYQTQALTPAQLSGASYQAPTAGTPVNQQISLRKSSDNQF